MLKFHSNWNSTTSSLNTTASVLSMKWNCLRLARYSLLTRFTIALVTDPFGKRSPKETYPPPNQKSITCGSQVFVAHLPSLHVVTFPIYVKSKVCVAHPLYPQFSSSHFPSPSRFLLLYPLPLIPFSPSFSTNLVLYIIFIYFYPFRNLFGRR
jgi:hypothetical protein